MITPSLRSIVCPCTCKGARPEKMTAAGMIARWYGGFGLLRTSSSSHHHCSARCRNAPRRNPNSGVGRRGFRPATAPCHSLKNPGRRGPRNSTHRTAFQSALGEAGKRRSDFHLQLQRAYLAEITKWRFPFCCSAPHQQAQSQRPVTLEGLPERIQARIEVKNRASANTPTAREWSTS